MEANISSVVLGKCDVVRRCTWHYWRVNTCSWKTCPESVRPWWARLWPGVCPGSFRRIQFTPDLLPADITGSSIFDSQRQEFFLRAARSSPTSCWPTKSTGQLPVPRLRSEAMSRAESADGRTYPLPQPFMVHCHAKPAWVPGDLPAAGKPIGSLRLRISVGYPDRVNELAVLTNHRWGEPVDRLEPVLNCSQIVQLQAAVRKVTVDDSIHNYLLDLVQATRQSDDLHVGGNADWLLYPPSQAAAVRGREYPCPTT